MVKRKKDAEIIPLFPEPREERKPAAPTQAAGPAPRLWTLACLELGGSGGPRALLWFDDASAQILTAGVGRISDLVEPALDGLDELFEVAREVGVAPPERVLVPAPELIDALAPALGERVDGPVEIEVGVSPRLQEHLATLVEEMVSAPNPGELFFDLLDEFAAELGAETSYFDLLDEFAAELGAETSYFGPKPIDLATIEALFDAAKALRRRKPKRYLSERDVIAVDLPALELEGAALVITEDEGQPALALHSSLDDLFNEFAPELIEDRERMGWRGPELYLIFVNKADMGPDLIDELKRMPFAPKRGPFPLPVAHGDDGELRPLRERDYVVLTAITGALANMLTPKRAEAWRDQREPLQADFTVNYGGVESEGRLHLPHPELEGSEGSEGSEASTGAPRTRYRLKITLRYIRPPIWRRVEVDAATTLAELHDIIQLAMGWENCHLYGFEHNKRRYGPSGVELGERDDTRVRLADLDLRKGSKLRYEYDFGDSWEHEVRVEAVDADAEAERPRCIKGRRACPPEDCGGVWGYEQLIEGSDFDADAFSAERADARLGRVFKRPR